MPSESFFGGISFYMRLKKLLALMKENSCNNRLYTVATKIFERSFNLWEENDRLLLEKSILKAIKDGKSDHIIYLAKAGLPSDFKVGNYRLMHQLAKHSLIDPLHYYIGKEVKIDSKIMEAAYRSKRHDIFLELMNYAGPSEHFKMIPVLVRSDDITSLKQTSNKIGFNGSQSIDKDMISRYWGYVLLSAYKTGQKDVFFEAKENSPSYEVIIEDITPLLILRKDFKFIDHILDNCINKKEIELTISRAAIKRNSIDLINHLVEIDVDLTEYTRTKAILQECDKISDPSIRLEFIQKLMGLMYKQARAKSEFETFKDNIKQIIDGVGIMPIKLSKSVKETISEFALKMTKSVNECVSVGKVDMEIAEEIFATKMTGR